MGATKPVSQLPVERWSRNNHFISDSLLALGSIILLTALIYFFHLYQIIPDSVLLYLLVILALASTRGLNAALQASFLAFFLFDFLFVPPLYSFVITKFEDIIALVVFLITAITTGHLASALRSRAEDASRREHETRILYEVVHATNREEDIGHQLRIFARSVVEIFASWGIHDCTVLLPAQDTKHQLLQYRQTSIQEDLPAIEEGIATEVMKQAYTIDIYGNTVIHHTAMGIVSSENKTFSIMKTTSPKHTIRFIPLKTEQRVVGVLRLLIEHTSTHMENKPGLAHERLTSQEVFFSTLLEQAITVIEHDRLQRESVHNKVLQQTDSLRAALLSSVSHDLRTPLTTIKSAASSIRQKDFHLDENEKDTFALVIERESDHLNRLVENLLDMSRIEGGALSPKKVWYPLEEIIYNVTGHMQEALKGRPIDIAIPAATPSVEIDYVQIGQVITNLLENALRYTPDGSPIDISIKVQEDTIQVSIADRGPGVSPAESERIFDKFYRVHREPHAADHDRGSGLGLAVSKGVIEAHNGHIWVEARKGGGAIFCFTLPKGETAEVQGE